METLRSRRKSLGLTLVELSARVGITPGQLSRIERFGVASLQVATKLEEETGVSAGTIGRQKGAS